jgi:hypothetical protein
VKAIPTVVLRTFAAAVLLSGPAPATRARAADPPSEAPASPARRATPQAEDRELRPAPAYGAAPLVIDPTDTGLGASVVFTRVPTAAELGELHWVENIDHVVLALAAWPATFDEISPLAQSLLPEGADLLVVLPGYPATRESAEAWNLLRRRVRIVMVVDGPPADRGMILTMNAIRGLERVIADMPNPSRSGFQRLQRPLSFRVVRP